MHRLNGLFLACRTHEIAASAAEVAGADGRAGPLVDICGDVAASGDPLGYFGAELLAWLALSPTMARAAAAGGVAAALLTMLPLLSPEAPLVAAAWSALLTVTASETPAVVAFLLPSASLRALQRLVIAYRAPLPVESGLVGSLARWEGCAAALTLLVRASRSGRAARGVVSTGLGFDASHGLSCFEMVHGSGDDDDDDVHEIGSAEGAPTSSRDELLRCRRDARAVSRTQAEHLDRMLSMVRGGGAASAPKVPPPPPAAVPARASAGGLDLTEFDAAVASLSSSSSSPVALRLHARLAALEKEAASAEELRANIRALMNSGAVSKDTREKEQVQQQLRHNGQIRCDPAEPKSTHPAGGRKQAKKSSKTSKSNDP